MGKISMGTRTKANLKSKKARGCRDPCEHRTFGNDCVLEEFYVVVLWG